VKYKVLIKKCEDPQRASRIAEEIARWSGSTADVVYGVITQKPVCIRKEAEKDEALRLRGSLNRLVQRLNSYLSAAELHPLLLQLLAKLQ
jgi:HAMP domain-containing protein